jgi:hypothetical protein
MAAGAALPSDDDDDAIQNASAPTLPPVQGAAPAPSGTPTAPPQAQPSLTPTPQGGIAQGTGNTKGEIATPTVVPQYDPKKLAKAQTTLDLLNAMKPASRTDYMDWWEKQHGDIDDKYDNLKQQLGARPADDEPQTKKEKFAALLEFGLHLMKNSAPASTNQGAVLAGTLSNSVDAAGQAHQATIASAQKNYDTQANAIESARDEEQKGIGTPADAMKAQAGANRQDAENLKDTASAFKDVSSATSERQAGMGAVTYAVGPGGVIHSLTRDEDGTAHAQPVTGIDGKPFQGRVLGKEAGSGIDKSGQDPAAVRTYKYATQVMGMDANAAAPILGVKPSGRPTADHAAIYKSVLSTTMGDTDKAKRIADQYVLDNYGAGAIPKANAAPIPVTPPPQALAGLQKGMVRHTANGDWTLGIDGKPVRVNAAPLSTQ